MSVGISIKVLVGGEKRAGTVMGIVNPVMARLMNVGGVPTLDQEGQA